MNIQVIGFGLTPKGKNKAEKIKSYNKNWDKAEKSAKDGKIINLTDLMAQAENIHQTK